MDKKELIYSTVVNIIKEKGIESDFKMSEVADVANIGKGTIYNYFNSKEDLILTSLLFHMETIVNNLLNIGNYNGNNFEENIKEFSSNVIMALENNEFIFGFITNEKIACNMNNEKRCILEEKVVSIRKLYHDLIKKFSEKDNIELSDIDIDLIGVIIQNITVNFRQNTSGYDKQSKEEIINIIYKYIERLIY